MEFSSVCGEADSLPSALIKIAESKPHLLVIGLRLGAADCVEFIKALKVQTPGLLILVYSGFEESIFAMRALRAGAGGFLLKDTPPGAPWEVDLRHTIAQTAQRNNIQVAGRMPAPGGRSSACALGRSDAIERRIRRRLRRGPRRTEPEREQRDEGRIAE